MAFALSLLELRKLATLEENLECSPDKGRASLRAIYCVVAK